ncbi:MAG: NAD(P)/FAD-dependent oxidoreductase [Halarcobacter sp.]
MVYPHKNNYIFWKTIKDIDEQFWLLKKVYYAKYSLSSIIKTTSSLFELIRVYKLDLLKSADSFIKSILPNITLEYKRFIDSQLLITLQTNSENIPLISLALGLSYPFHDVFYANGGMGKIFDDLLFDFNINKKEIIRKIHRDKDIYRLVTNKDEYLFKNVVLNSTIYDSKNLFDDKKIIDYYSKFSFYDQSAFVIYLKLDSKESFLNHYQIILDKAIPNCISNSFFISFSKIDDKKLSNNGYSITISSHTKALFWENLSKEDYKIKKELTQNFIISKFLEYFKSLKKEDIIYKTSGSSKTFKRYINRNNCGGQAIFMKDLLKIPSCKTPFKGLYNIGDTVFAGQGWPGIAIGVEVLNSELNNG